MAISRLAALLLPGTSVQAAFAAARQQTLRAKRLAPSLAFPGRELPGVISAAVFALCAGLPRLHRVPYAAAGDACDLHVTVAGVPVAVPVMPVKAVARRNTGIPCPAYSPAMFPYQGSVPDSGKAAAGVVAALVVPVVLERDKHAGDSPARAVVPAEERAVSVVLNRPLPRPGRIANHSSPVVLAVVAALVVVRRFPCSLYTFYLSACYP